MKLVAFTLALTTNAYSASCSADMVRRGGAGRTIDTFFGQSYGHGRYARQEACDQARRRCMRDLRHRQRNGRNLRAVCLVQGRRGGGMGPGRVQVTRHCSTALVESDRWGSYTVDRFHAQAIGPRGTGVKARACEKSQRKCQRNRRYAQRCVTQR